MAINQKIKLLIVDDSIFFRKALAGALAGDQRVEVVGQRSEERRVGKECRL